MDVEAIVPSGEATGLSFERAVLVLPRCEGPGEEGAARERDAREAVERRRFGRLVAAVLPKTLVEVAVPAKPADDAVVDAARDLFDLVLLGRPGLVETHAAVRFLEHAIDRDNVKMHMEVETRAESLRKGQAARLAVGDLPRSSTRLPSL